MSVKTRLVTKVEFEETLGMMTAKLSHDITIPTNTDDVDVWAVQAGSDGEGEAIVSGSNSINPAGSLTDALNRTSQTMARLLYMIFENLSATASMTVAITNFNTGNNFSLVFPPGSAMVWSNPNNEQATNALGTITVTGTTGEKYKLGIAGQSALAT